MGALSIPIQLVKGSSEQFFVFASAHLEPPSPQAYAFDKISLLVESVWPHQLKPDLELDVMSRCQPGV